MGFSPRIATLSARQQSAVNQLLSSIQRTQKLKFGCQHTIPVTKHDNSRLFRQVKFP
jgi:hypothetical protein